MTVPAAKGQMGILPSHAPLLASLTSGEVAFRRSGQPARHLAISGGYAEVLSEKVTLLVETAEAPEEIDVERAKSSRERAEKEIAGFARRADSAGREEAAFREAEARLHRAVARLQVARKAGGGGSAEQGGTA